MKSIIRRALTALIIMAGAAFISRAQIPDLEVPSVTPPSPQAGETAKYISYPVDLSNGLVRIEIPLYEIVEGDIRIPISLSYHASGMKPNLRSSRWLGDGWSLSTGPSLSRSINGGADELFYNSTIASEENPSREQLKAVTDQSADTELDEFRYGLPGGGGRLYFRNPDRSDRRAVTIPDDRIKVSVPLSGGLSSEIDLTDRNGVTYKFGSSQERYHDYSASKWGGSFHWVPTSWKIREIRSASTGRSVRFSYTQSADEILCCRYADALVILDRYNAQQEATIPAVQASHGSGTAAVKYYRYDNTAHSLVEAERTDLLLPTGYSFPTPTRQEMDVRNSYPERIDFSEGYVKFIRASDTRNGLARIEVYDLFNVLVRKIVFTQTYNSGELSLRLNSVSVQSPSGGDAQTYTFAYNGTPVPRDTRGVDRWGYHNGHDSNTTLVPSVTTKVIVHNYPVGYDEEVEVTVPGGNREPDELAMQRGVLTSITYPAGGRTEFSYEAHRYVDDSSRVRLAGGLRIRQIRDMESTGNVLYRNFRYSTERGSVTGTGVLNVHPEGAVSPADTNFIYYRETLCNEFAGLGGPAATYKERVWSDNSMVDLFSDAGSSVSYPYVVETRSSNESGTSISGLTVHTFDIRQSHPLKVAGTDMVSDRLENWKNGAGTCSEAYRAQSMPSVIPSGNSGLASRTASGYTAEYSDGDATTTLRQMKAFRSMRVYGADEDIVDPQYKEIRFITTLLSQGRNLLTSRDETTAGSNGSVTRSVAYEYDTYGNVVKTTESVGLPGYTSRITAVSYPQDRTGAIYSDMVTAGMTGVPVETRVYRNSISASNLLTTETTMFASHACYGGTFIAPASKSLTVKGNSGSTRTVLFTEYDRRGNLIEAQGVDGLRTVYLWGYRGSRPVAQIAGSSWSAVKSSCDTSALNTGSASTIASRLGSIRSAFASSSGVHVTTCTWTPLLGAAVVTDPSGRNATHYYDCHGRLTSSFVYDGSYDRKTASYTYSNGGTPQSNYVRTTTYLTTAGSTSAAVESTAYTDRLGRTVETVVRNGGKSGSAAADLVTLNEYDAFGRPFTEYAPFPVPAGTPSGRSAGAYVVPATAKNSSASFHGDSYAFSKTLYEDSPLDRPQEQYGPGASWHTGHRRTLTETLVNSTSVDSLICGRYYAASSTSLKRDGNFPDGSLLVAITKDEDGRTALSFTDRLGRTVLERRVNRDRYGQKEFLDTYYIHDELGLLCYVLTPNASASMTSSTTWQDSHTVLQSSCYIYKYDSRGRCTSKKTPGNAAVYIRYDKADRPVFTQNGTDRNLGRWTFTLTDPLGREAVTGTWPSPTVPDVSSSYPKVTLGSSYGTLGGYVPTGITVPVSATPRRVSYYDNLSFLNLLSSTDRTMLTADAKAGYGTAVTAASSMKGMLTGISVHSVDSPSSRTVSALYYDALGRAVQTRRAEAEGGWRTTHLLNSFTGKPLKELETVTLSLSGGTPDTFETVRTYDSMDRPVSETCTLNGCAQSVTFGYDGAGRVGSRTYGAGTGSVPQTETLAYNVRNWLTSSSSGPFTMTLRYNNAAHGAKALHAGNISEWEWSRGAGSPVNAWKLAYDRCGRLTAADRLTGTSSSSLSATDAFSEKGIAYDRNGNVTALTRYGQSATSPEDALSYTYSGDRIASISNSGSLGGGGSYTYDADGNVTHDGLSGLDMEYNAIGLTKKIARSGSTLAEYSYLADGARLSAVGSDGTGVRYLGSLIYSRASDGTLSLDCALTPGGRIVRTAGAGTSGTYQVQHFLRDHLGSVRAVVDGATGGVLETSDYLPLGKRWDLTGGQSSQTVTDPTNRWRFSGKESQAFFDQGIPYSDFGARLHDPRTGRWLAPDPLAEKYYGLSQFGYCAGDPVKFIDDGGADLVLAGANKSSVTFKTDLVDMSINVGKIGIDWGGNYSLDGKETLSAALDLAGFLDPTGVADGANALLLASDGDYWGAVMSGLSVLPLGDLLKAPRVGKNIGILSDAVDAVKSVHGNSKASTNAQHLYEIFDKETGIVVKTGISGGKESK
ncbi:MAG: DUF6443 domain-containing protein, partial [Bacteroidales bacterium]|nr:DUF6443 domain-containing protein [Bacteroidales bacterium]